MEVENLEKATSVSEKEIEKRKKDLIKFFKEKISWIVYGILAVIIFMSIYIRTLNIPKLKDITTGTWTLGPDLDPFLFLRWAQYIAEHGKLFIVDTMRYVPLANICSGASCIPVNTSTDMKLLSYLIAWFYKFLAVFDQNVTVNYAAVIFPVVMAVFTGIAFFLFARKLFYKEDKKIANIIALVATVFFVLTPSLLPRTIAGIPGKESVAFFFIFIGLYFFLESFTSEKLKTGIIFALLSGISTGLADLIWGGGELLLVMIVPAVFFAFLLGKINNKRFWFFSCWLIATFATMIPFSTRYSLGGLINSGSSGIMFIVFFILAVDFLIFKKDLFNTGKKLKKIKLPEPLISFSIALVLGIIISVIILGPSFIINIAKDIISNTIHPIGINRFNITVAENAAPYFINDWINSFGPVIFNIPLYFWMLIFGAVALFSNLISSLHKKERRLLILSYFIMLMGLVFSKYSSSSILNGDSVLSIIVYFGGVIILLGSFGYVYYKRNKTGEFLIFKDFNFAYLLYFVMLTMAIITARGAVDLILVLGAVSPVAVAFLIVKSCQRYFKEKEDMMKLLIGLFVIILLIAAIFTFWSYYSSDKNMAENYAPSVYTMQWQKAMAWVRTNTPTDAVFAHWWDYGYWVQTIGERATILDGGNAIGYWDYLMGRDVLTTPNESDALDFLYAHNGTDLLIDSTDIGKYSAFSSIGSDANYDRYSWIPTILKDDTQTIEKSNETDYVYPVGTILDNDIILDQNGQEVLLPQMKAAVAAIETRESTNGQQLQPIIFYVYNNQQYQMPLRYVDINNTLDDFGSGIDAGIFIFPSVNINSNGQITNIDMGGAAFYLSGRTIHSELVRLYLFNQPSNYFTLAHSEGSLINEQLNAQGLNLGDFVYYTNDAGFQGPIKIWTISYPPGMKVNQTYLSINYPDLSVTIAKPDEYSS